MVDRNRQAGAHCGVLTGKMLRNAEAIFEEWLDENSTSVHDMGGTGDSHVLFAALWASWKKAEKSATDIPIAF